MVRLPVIMLVCLNRSKFRAIALKIWTSNMKPEITKKGILILVMKGCTITEQTVISSCQYNGNNRNDAATNGRLNSAKVTMNHSGYKRCEPKKSMETINRTEV